MNTNSVDETKYIVNGLEFDSENDYFRFVDLDKYISDVVCYVKDGKVNLEEFFNQRPRINVRELYPDAREELDTLFENATRLLFFEGTRFNLDYEVGAKFFDKINIIPFSEDEVDDIDDLVDTDDTSDLVDTDETSDDD